MRVKLKCPNPECGIPLTLDTDWAGKKGTCSSCEKSFKIPANIADLVPKTEVEHDKTIDGALSEMTGTDGDDLSTVEAKPARPKKKAAKKKAAKKRPKKKAPKRRPAPVDDDLDFEDDVEDYDDYDDYDEPRRPKRRPKRRPSPPPRRRPSRRDDFDDDYDDGYDDYDDGYDDYDDGYDDYDDGYDDYGPRSSRGGSRRGGGRRGGGNTALLRTAMLICAIALCVHAVADSFFLLIRVLGSFKVDFGTGAIGVFGWFLLASNVGLVAGAIVGIIPQSKGSVRGWAIACTVASVVAAAFFGATVIAEFSSSGFIGRAMGNRRLLGLNIMQRSFGSWVAEFMITVALTVHLPLFAFFFKSATKREARFVMPSFIFYLVFIGLTLLQSSLILALSSSSPSTRSGVDGMVTFFMIVNGLTAIGLAGCTIYGTIAGFYNRSRV